ncbi:MAG: gamma-glutamyl-gamma-aminobutyrate hydrolase family protein [Bacteroidales bacterium]|nr:gamma-glutamyl-gamma-aminobutyrate hydrolase family protein [Bacteroidales bacterium]
MKRCILLITLLAMTACQHARLPLVGISCSRNASGGSTLSAAYSNAIAQSGGIPVILPTVSDPAVAASLLEELDGIVFSGGEDVDPSRYGETFWNETVRVDTLRDVSDFLLAEAAVASGKPILAICRGAQLMNVVLGGTLYQDLPTQVAGVIEHRGDVRHKIGVEQGSILFGLFGKDSLEVNSSHHQAVKDPAPGIRITAHGPDGIIEAYETPQVTAYQFHPERLARDDASWLVLFRQWIGEVRKRR